jgi:gamma-glutamyl-gamma-aminobutyrate hydrolase PuuD
MTRSVYVVGNDELVSAMFKKREGYTLTDSLEEAGIVVFTGGEDVSPYLYGEQKLKVSYCNPLRDQKEVEVHKAIPEKTIKVGICRGGQFLNVMNGGRMYQDVDNHTRTHKVYNALTKECLGEVTSTHHQMMIPHASGEIIVQARETTSRVRAIGEFVGVFRDDTEVVVYPRTKTLCFQPHPEYGHENTESLFFQILEGKF